MLPDVSTMFRVIDLVGVVLNGIIGGMVARERRFDIVGFMLLAIVSALGGGLVRDVLLNTRPLALADSHYLMYALLGAVIAYVVPLRGRWWQVTLPVLDSLALGTWAASGTARSLQFGVHGLPALLLGLATAVGGGTIRDVAVGDVPSVFGGNRLYAIPALLSAGTVLLAHAQGWAPTVGLVSGTGIGTMLALLASVFGWSVPAHGEVTFSAVRRRLRPVRGRREPRER